MKPSLSFSTVTFQSRATRTERSDAYWEKLVAQNPRANEKFQALWASAMSNLDMDAIQAKIMLCQFDKIEQIENLIAIAERRFDAIIREMDRRRLLRVHFVEAEKPKMIEQKMRNRKVA